MIFAKILYKWFWNATSFWQTKDLYNISAKYFLYSFITYRVGVYNILGGPMQHHIPVPRKSYPWRPWFVDLAPLAMNLARQSFVGGRSDNPVPIPASLSSFWLESAEYLTYPAAMAMATATGCPEEVDDLGGTGLVAGGDPSEKISLCPLWRLYCVAGVGSGVSPSLPMLRDRENVDFCLLLCGWRGGVGDVRSTEDRRAQKATDRWARSVGWLQAFS
jgi:hypothetical protein